MRRVLLGLCALALLGSGWTPALNLTSVASAQIPSGFGPAVRPDASAENPIHQENQQTGTTSWQSPGLQALATQKAATAPRPLDPHPETAAARGQSIPPFSGATAPLLPTPFSTQPGAAATAAAQCDSPQSESWVDTALRGYADKTSINKGESIAFKVSTSRARYNLDVFRVGWYGGDGASLKLSVPNLTGQNQAVPAAQSGTGLIAANWATSYTLQTDATWVSGFYLVHLTDTQGDDSYIIFVLRDDSQQADIVYQVALANYQAYNNWGGKSTYDYNSTNCRAYKVSYDRPYSQWMGTGDFFDGDYNMIRFLESQGYNITYTSSLDTHNRPSVLNGRKVFFSNWHDEYWSKQMRDNVTAARDAGMDLAFVDSNNVYRQIRFEPSASGVADRVLVCYKDASKDPMRSTNPSLTTIEWRDPILNQPENALLGVMYESLFNFGSGYPWVVSNASHWIYAGTGLQNGQSIPGLIGYEYDKIYSNGQSPANLQVLATSPVVDINNVSSTSNATIYTVASGAMVFSAGTNYFAWKVDTNPYQAHGVDTRAQRIVNNLLSQMISGTTTPPPSTPTRTPTTATGATPTRTPTTGTGATPTPTPTSGAGTLLNSWDVAGSTQGWAVAWAGAMGTPTQSTAQAHMGTGSLQVPLTFSGAGWKDGGVVTFPSPTGNWAGQGTDISVWAYLPAGAPANQIQALIFAEHSTWDWLTSPWVTLVPGQWTEIHWTAAPLTDIAGLGIQVGASDQTYTGTLYLDQLMVVGAGAPANTPTMTPTALPATATRTSTPVAATATRTATTLPATATATATATRTSTPAAATATPTRTNTPAAATATATRTSTPVAGGTGAVVYDWEVANNTAGWQSHWTGVVGTPAQAAGTAHQGTGALRLPLTFSGGTAWKDGGAAVFPNPAVNWNTQGTNLSVWIFLPTGAPAGKIGASIYLQHATWDWFESPWVTLVPGQWTEVRFTNPPLTGLAAVGVQFGATGVTYSGNALIDQFAVLPSGAGTGGADTFAAGRVGTPPELGAAAVCTPRPEVSVATVPGANGSLQVTVSARSSSPSQANTLQALNFGAGTNTRVDAGTQVGAAGAFSVPLPAGTQQTTFTVRPATAGQAMTVPLTVVDSCGAWPTFVGRGPS